MTYQQQVSDLAKRISKIATEGAVTLGKRQGTQAFRDVSEVLTGLAIALGEAVGMDRDDLVTVVDGIWEQSRKMGGAGLRVVDLLGEEQP